MPVTKPTRGAAPPPPVPGPSPIGRAPTVAQVNRVFMDQWGSRA